MRPPTEGTEPSVPHTAATTARTTSSSDAHESTLASEDIAAKLKHDILSGRIALGSSITERWITEQYSSSRTTVREVLQLLVTERYLERKPFKSASVRTFNEREMRDNLAARLLLETEAARKCGTAAVAELTHLQRAVTTYCDALDADDALTATAAHRELHVAIVATTGNSALTRFQSELMQDASLFLDVINTRRDDVSKMRREHVRLVGAFMSGDAALAEQLVTSHLHMVTEATETLH